MTQDSCIEIVKWKRPDVLRGQTIKVNTECGNLYVFLNKENGKLIEVRAELGKCGNCVKNLLQIICIFISVTLQELPDDKKIKTILHLEEVSCGNPFYYEGTEYLSCSDFIARITLKELGYIKTKVGNKFVYVKAKESLSHR